MKHIIFTLLVLTAFYSCSQPAPVNQNPNITADNLVEEIAKQVKHYPSEKIYGIDYSNDNCYFDMFIDNIKVPYNRGRGIITGGAIDVNELLPHSGKYRISYKMYPLYTLEERGVTITQNTLVDKSYVTLEVYSYNLKDKNARDISYAEYTTPNIAINQIQRSMANL